MNSTPASLLERLHDPKDRLARERLVEFCQGYFFYWATKTLRWSKEEVEDFVQELFAIVFSKLPTFKYNPQQRFRGWLFTIARNLAAEKRRKWAQANTGRPADSEIAISDDCLAFDEREFNAFLVQRARKIMQADFEPATLLAFDLQVCEGKSGPEVAALLGITPAAAYVAKSRVLKRLREELQGVFDAHDFSVR